eukprot:752396-Hanusia_phi.AAC.3
MHEPQPLHVPEPCSRAHFLAAHVLRHRPSLGLEQRRHQRVPVEQRVLQRSASPAVGGVGVCLLAEQVLHHLVVALCTRHMQRRPPVVVPEVGADPVLNQPPYLRQARLPLGEEPDYHELLVVDGRLQRRLSPPVLDVLLCSAVEQDLDHAVVSLRACHVQYRPLVVVRLVDVRSLPDQLQHRLNVPRVGGVGKREEEPLGSVFDGLYDLSLGRQLRHITRILLRALDRVSVGIKVELSQEVLADDLVLLRVAAEELGAVLLGEDEQLEILVCLCLDRVHVVDPEEKGNLEQAVRRQRGPAGVHLSDDGSDVRDVAADHSYRPILLVDDQRGPFAHKVELARDPGGRGPGSAGGGAGEEALTRLASRSPRLTSHASLAASSSAPATPSWGSAQTRIGRQTYVVELRAAANERLASAGALHDEVMIVGVGNFDPQGPRQIHGSGERAVNILPILELEVRQDSLLQGYRQALSLHELLHLLHVLLVSFLRRILAHKIVEKSSEDQGTEINLQHTLQT